MPQDIAKPLTPSEPELTPQQVQEAQVRWNYLLAQMNGIRQAARQLQVNLILANMNDELTSDFKKEIRAQMKQIAATMEEGE